MAGSTSEKIRAFVALAPEPGLIAKLQNVQRQLQTRLPVGIVRWTMPEQLHLTLKFLGGVSVERLAGLAAALDRAGAGIAPFQLALEGVGCFPHAKNPRVVWIGIQGELHSLRKLQTQIEHETQPCGDHTEERPFRPHLTIGRVKAFGKEVGKMGEVVERAFIPKLGDWTVRQIHLVQSELRPEGVRYTTRASARLLGGNADAARSQPSPLEGDRRDCPRDG